jgi:hypothetical protein
LEALQQQLGIKRHDFIRAIGRIEAMMTAAIASAQAA